MAFNPRGAYFQQGTSIQATLTGVTIPAYDLNGLLVKTLTLLNRGPAPFTAGSLESSPDGNVWEGYDGTTFQTLGSGVQKSLNWGLDARRYWRFSSQVASGSVGTFNWWWTF